MPSPTPEENNRIKIQDIVDEMLGDDKIVLGLSRFAYCFDEEKQENFIKMFWQQSTVSGEGRVSHEIESHGNGAVDALFSYLTSHYSPEFKTIKGIKFENFYVRPFFKKSGSGSNAEVEVVMEFNTKRKKIVTFRHTSKSFVLSAAKVIFSAVEFYINAEKAFKKLRFLIKDAKNRSRGDLFSEYSYKLSIVVDATSYIGV